MPCKCPHVFFVCNNTEEYKSKSTNTPKPINYTLERKLKLIKLKKEMWESFSKMVICTETHLLKNDM